MRTLALSVLGLVTLSACGPDEAAAPPPPIPRKKAADTAPPPAAVALVDYSYDPVGKRDPFRGTQTTGGNANKPEGQPGDDCTTPLCLSNVDEFTVVGIVSGDTNPMAMVEDRAGVGYILRRTTRIGKSGGKVTQIRRDCVEVTSYVTGGESGKQANKQEICLRADVRSQNPIDLLKNREFIP